MSRPEATIRRCRRRAHGHWHGPPAPKGVGPCVIAHRTERSQAETRPENFVHSEIRFPPVPSHTKVARRTVQKVPTSPATFPTPIPSLSPKPTIHSICHFPSRSPLDHPINQISHSTFSQHQHVILLPNPARLVTKLRAPHCGSRYGRLNARLARPGILPGQCGFPITPRPPVYCDGCPSLGHLARIHCHCPACRPGHHGCSLCPVCPFRQCRARFDGLHARSAQVGARKGKHVAVQGQAGRACQPGHAGHARGNGGAARYRRAPGAIRLCQSHEAKGRRVGCGKPRVGRDQARHAGLNQSLLPASLQLPRARCARRPAQQRKVTIAAWVQARADGFGQAAGPDCSSSRQQRASGTRRPGGSNVSAWLCCLSPTLCDSYESSLLSSSCINTISVCWFR